MGTQEDQAVNLASGLECKDLLDYYCAVPVEEGEFNSISSGFGLDYKVVGFVTQFPPIYQKVELYRGANVEDILRQLLYAHFAYKQRLWFKIKSQEGDRITVEVYDKETDECVSIQNPSL